LKIKICGNRSDQDIKIAVEAGADAVGFLVGQIHASKDFILPSTAARLAEALPPFVTPVIVTHLIEAEAIMEIISKTGIKTIQLHGDISSDETKKLRDQMPSGGKIIMSSYLVNNNCKPPLESFYPFINAVLLDCYNKEPGLIGGDDKGKKHDWAFSAEFVKNCPKPVILAGGLSPANVMEAINTVKPFGIDANSRLKTADRQGHDRESCIDFVRNSRNASTSMMPASLE